MGRFFEISADGELHRYLEDDLPLVIGTGEGAHIRVAAGKAVEARIGLHEGGYLYLQPASGATDVFHNDKLITDSAWIKSGDRTRIGDQILQYRISGDRVEIILADWSGPDFSAEEQGSGSSSGEYGGPSVDTTFLPRLERESGRPGFSGKNIVLGLVFLLLLLAALFVLTARSVEVHITPKPESLSLHGMLPLLPFGDRFLGVVGSYRLEASSPGYRDLQAEIIIKGSGFSRYSFSLEKLDGLLEVTSTPAGAEVFVDGNSRGPAPLDDLEISAGTHELRCTLERYQDARLEVEVRGLGERQSVNCTLQPDWGKVFVVTDPPGATIFEKDTEIGRTPQTAELDLGEHSLVLRKKGYKDFSLNIAVEAGKTLVPPMVMLKRKSVHLQLDSKPAGALVTLDGSSRGKTPVRLDVEPGRTYRIGFSLAGYRPMTKTAAINNTGGQKISVSLQPVPGKAPPVKAGAAPAQAASAVGKESTASQGTKTKGVVAKKGPEMLLLKPAVFTMGASRREPGRRANESKHQVEITRPFLLGVHEITNAEYRRFKPAHRSGFFGGLTLDGDRQPVVTVSWQDAARYCNWLSRQQGLAPFYREQGATLVPVRPATSGYRLPFEAEWAYAARMVGRTRPGRYPWDGGFPPHTRNGNYADESARSLLPVVIKGYYDGFPVTAPVDSFPRNMGGFFDMGGNASEWCHDFYSPNPGPVSGKSVDPTGPEKGSYHVVRGSSWRDGAMTELRLSFRGYSKKSKDSLGFRIARYAQ